MYAVTLIRRAKTVPEFKSSKDIARWLRGKPREYALVIAARAAIRVTPMLIASLGPRGGGVEKVGREIILPVFRGMASSWFASAWPKHSARLNSNYSAAARAAGVAAAAASASAAAYAADAAFRAAAASTARDVRSTIIQATNATAAAAASTAYAAGEAAVANSPAAANAARAAVYAAISVDASLLETEANTLNAVDSAVALAHRQLWPDDVPEWADMEWIRLERLLLATNPNWKVWTTWYRNRCTAPGSLDTSLI